MTNRHPNLIDENYKTKVVAARKYVKNLIRRSDIYAVAHFDLTGSTKKMIKDQESTITEMLTHNKICRNLIKANGGIATLEKICNGFWIPENIRFTVNVDARVLQKV